MVTILVALQLAVAAEAPEDDLEVGTIELPEGPPLPSALDTPADLPDDPDDLARLLDELGLTEEELAPPALVRGLWFFAPHTQVASLVHPTEAGPIAMRLGLTVGRRYTTSRVLPVQLQSEISLGVLAPVGGAVGRRVMFNASIGPWLGRFRVQLGLHGRWEEEKWRRRSLVLDDALLLGPDVRVALDASWFVLTAGLLPLFAIGDQRGPPLDRKLPRLGTETVYSGGIGVSIRPILIFADVSWRDTDIGGILEIGPRIRFDLGGSR